MHVRIAATLALAGCLAVLVSACGGKSNDNSSADTGGGESGGGEALTIGMSVEKTGPLSVLGPGAEGAEAAVKYVNANGGFNGQPVKLIVKDNASQSSRAIQSVGDLVASGASIIVGPLFVQDCAAIAGTVAKEKIPNICASPSELIEEAPPYQYGIGPATSQEDQAVYKYFAEQGIKKVGTLAATDQSGEQAEEWAKEFGEEESGLSVQVEKVNPAATTFKPQLEKMISDGVEAVYATSCGGVSITGASEAISLNYKGQYLLINCFASEGVAGSIKGFVNGNIVTMAPEFMLGPPYEEQRKEAIETYVKEVGVNEITVGDGWDAVLLAVKAAEEAGSTDPEAINETLENNFEFIGIWAGGTFTPDDHRGQITDGVLEPAVFTKDGKLERIK